MKCPRPIGLVLVVTLSMVHCLPLETTTTTTRSTPAFGDTIKKVTNQLIDANATKLDMVLDTRTPPKVKQQVKLKEEMEHSHAGVAIPVDDDTIEMDESTKKMNFYKIERPTTNSGLSTWILLSGQEASTVKPTTKKPVIKPLPQNTTRDNVTVIVTDKPTRIVKPIFRKRTPSTPKPTTTTTVVTTTKVTTEPTKLTKIKASILNNAVHKRNLTTTKLPITTTTTTTKLTTTTALPTTISVKNVTVEATTIAANLTAEAKEGEVDLTNQNKKKKTTNKRRKNKPKRRKTTNKTNSTSVAKPNKTHKQNAVSSQLYNYLAREIMPTVGVGLVGLMVTAGLASYFLYPFGAARRSSYDIDRKDKEGSYYYSDAYSGGIPEEEAIGKVIAGMPTNTLFPSNNYKSPAAKDAYPESKYTLKDRRAQIRPQYYGDIVQGTVDNIPVTPKNYYQSNSYDPVTYTNNQPSRYSPTVEQQFVVGNVPKEVTEEATPAAVPEHGPRTFNLEENLADEPTYFFKGDDSLSDIRKDYGPRSLKIRRKRSGISNEIEDEIDALNSNYRYSTLEYQTTNFEMETTTMQPTTLKPTSTTTTAVGLPQKVSSFIDMMKDLIQLKARMGLQIIQNITDGISKYISNVQSRLDEQYKNVTKLSN